MIKKILIVLLLGLFLLGGCEKQPFGSDPRVIEREDMSYREGIIKGIESCEEHYKPMLEQFIPTDNCMILILDRTSMKYICEGSKYYDELND